MFCDNLDAKMPINTDERWYRHSDERDEYGLYCDFMTVTGDDGRPRLVDDPDWVPRFREERMLEGADYEAVICHECAHELCAIVPWIDKLLQPFKSHSHKSDYHEAHPEHWGWDYERRRNA